MRRGRHLRAARARASASVRQLVVGLVALPLSALPLIGYLNFTPEGRLVRDRAMVGLFRPVLPELTAAQAGAAAEAAPRYRGGVMALAYHGIGSTSDAEGGFVIPPKRFGEHLATLEAAGMTTVTASDVTRSFETGDPLPDNAVMISFDDGRTDAMLFADPLLEDAGMSATMFVITDAAAEPGIYYASWDKLESYAGSGRWDLQAHTADLHREQEVAGGGRLPALTSLAPGETLDEFRARVRLDLGAAADSIEEHVGRRPVAFAYPFGAYGAERTNDPAIRSILAEEVDRRFAVAFHQDDQESVPLATPADDRLGLRRLEVQDWSGLELLGRIGEAAGRTPGVVVGLPAASGDPPADPVPAGDAAPTTTAPPGTAPAPATPTTTGPRPAATGRPPTSATTAPRPTGTVAPRPTVPPTTAPAPGTTVPPATSPTTGPTTTTQPPAPTTTTTRPPTPTTTTTTVPPTTTTTSPGGCRSRGQGNVCSPGKA